MSDSPTQLDLLNERLAAYQLCEMSILKGHQSYTMGDGVTYSRADLRIVRKAIDDLQYQIATYDHPAFTQTEVRFV